MAPGASPVSTSTNRRSAVSCELFQTSSACCSGESSSPNAAWMPPCAFAELHDWSAPFVASATRAPARSADTAAASPEAPLPITSTSKESRSDTSSRLYQRLGEIIVEGRSPAHSDDVALTPEEVGGGGPRVGGNWVVARGRGDLGEVQQRLAVEIEEVGAGGE